MDQQNLSSRVLAPYATFVALFIGAGFTSGGIVHLGEGFNWWDASLLALGVMFFVLGSYIQEILYHKKALQEEGVVAFLAYSLLLSIGVGMASGGTQHFVDTPTYSAYLIPLGLLIGVAAFTLKQNIELTNAQWKKLLLGGVVLSVALGVGLSVLARTVPTSLGHGSHTHNTEERGSGHEAHKMLVQSEAEFLQQMIPHHQEAVDTSAYMLTRTANPELLAFVARVIDAQAEEIQQMKMWQRSWFGTEYRDDGSYVPMMEDLSKVTGTALDQTYIRGMIDHHRGAIQMAEQVLQQAPRPEVKTMAEAIIRTQTEEIRQLELWGEGKPETEHHH